jgi:hypothetical protein
MALDVRRLSCACAASERLPFLDLLLQRSEIPLRPIDADHQAVFEEEVLRMLCA